MALSVVCFVTVDSADLAARLTWIKHRFHLSFFWKIFFLCRFCPNSKRKLCFFWEKSEPLCIQKTYLSCAVSAVAFESHHQLRSFHTRRLFLSLFEMVWSDNIFWDCWRVLKHGIDLCLQICLILWTIYHLAWQTWKICFLTQKSHWIWSADWLIDWLQCWLFLVYFLALFPSRWNQISPAFILFFRLRLYLQINSSLWSWRRFIVRQTVLGLRAAMGRLCLPRALPRIKLTPRLGEQRRKILVS